MKRKGTYVLFLLFLSDLETEVGSLGHIILPAGWYCYVGSAMGGLDQRVSRHLAHAKTVRWHIDRLTVAADEMFAMEHEGDGISECALGRILEDAGAEPITDGFGCSDCACRTHLFRTEPDDAVRVLASRGLTKFVDKRQNSTDFE